GRRDVLEVMERLRKHTTIFYSTHILSDVQRVSDTVAILNKGQLIAQAPIDQLLAGGSGATIYQMELKGDPAAIQQQVAAQPWVSSIKATASNSHTHWQVTVTDENSAEDQLLRLVLSDGHITVTEFGRKKYDLEEVFLGLVEGSNHGKQ
ncbi:MAG TPA: ABC transporter ATP-binding protein, partial [Anaerolineae bacterium]|nr:ABC transporter ATP-binding protein [Anaerolineae bacterium]